jgi:glycosyltransferase involved in cell wall biosynthesis
MRVLIVNNFVEVTGGADRHCLDLADALSGAGHSVRFVSTVGARGSEAGSFVARLVDHRTRDELPVTTRAAVAARAVWNRSAAAATHAEIARLRPDLVHTHKLYPQLSVAPVLAAVKRGVPVVQTAHDYEFISASAEDSTGKRIDRREVRLQYQALNSGLHVVKRRFHVPAIRKWIAVSNALAGRYRNAGIESTTIANFTSPSDVVPPPRAGRSGVVFAGRLEPHKGVDDVIELAAALSNVPVEIAGTGTMQPAVERASEELGNLRYLGRLRQGEVACALRRSAVAVFPSKWDEPGALTCLEAMSAGTPVVAYRSGGLAEYVQNARAGTVTERNSDELMRAVSHLLSAEGYWQQCSANAIAATNSVHSREQYVSRVLEVYASALEPEPQ